MTTREELYKLIDQLPDTDLEDARHDLLKRLAQHDPALQAWLEAPEDDEPVTLEEEESYQLAWDEYQRGEHMAWAKFREELPGE